MDGYFITELMATDSDISMAFPHIFTKLCQKPSSLKLSQFNCISLKAKLNKYNKCN